MDSKQQGKHLKAQHIDLNLEPVPDLRTRASLAALLDIRWCSTSVHFNNEDSRVDCESLMQLWAPTLAAHAFRYDSWNIVDNGNNKGTVASWIIPFLRTQEVANTQSEDIECFIEARAMIFDRLKGTLLLSLHERMEAKHDSLDDYKYHKGLITCLRPRFVYPFIEATKLSRTENERIWLSTSFLSRQENREIPFSIYASSRLADRVESLHALKSAAQRFASAIAPPTTNHSEIITFVEGEAIKSHQHRLARREKLRAWFTARRRFLQMNTGGKESLNVVLGGEATSGEERGPTFDTNKSISWAVTDVNTLDITDYRDWEEMGLVNRARNGSLTFPLRLLAEHVLEHLTLSELHAALSNIRLALSSHNHSGSMIRLAVPAADATDSVGSKDADIRDWHHGRFTAWSLCDALRAHGLSGKLLEWHYPISAESIVQSTFNKHSNLIETKISTNLGSSIQRVHPWNTHAAASQNIKRSYQGGDTRGAVSIVIDAYLYEGGEFIDNLSGEQKSDCGDLCHLLLRAIEESQSPGVWAFDTEGNSTARISNDKHISAADPTGDTQSSAVAFTNYKAEKHANDIHWLVGRAFSTTNAAVSAHMSSLTRKANESLLKSGDFAPDPKKESSLDERIKMTEHINLLTAASEDAWCTLSRYLSREGQQKLAIRAVLMGLRFVSPRSIMLLEQQALLRGGTRKYIPASSLINAPENEQIFDEKQHVPVVLDLSTFDLSHPDAFNIRHVSATTYLHKLIQQKAVRSLDFLAIRACVTVSFLGDDSFSKDDFAHLEKSPFVVCIPESRVPKSAFGEDNPTAADFELSGMESGWYILRLYLWWLPSYIPASEVSGKRAPNRRFCIRGRFSTLTGMDVCDRAYSTAAAESDQKFAASKSGNLSLLFVTIVYNGLPFLKHHAPIFSQAAATLNVPWKWHIVEGIAVGRADAEAPYSYGLFDLNGSYNMCSVDGTFEYLNEITEPGSTFSEHISVYRGELSPDSSSEVVRNWSRSPKSNRSRDQRSSQEENNINRILRRKLIANESCVWIDKLQMINAGIHSMSEPGVLFQIDVDELWTVESIVAAYRLIAHGKSPKELKVSAPKCLRVHCHFFIAPNLVTVTKNGYGHSDEYEWTRVWAFSPGDTFASHAPPILLQFNGVREREYAWDILGGEQLEQSINGSFTTRGVPCLNPESTVAAGVGFTHYAYVYKEQVQFKERFYGYEGATEAWQRLVHALSRNDSLQMQQMHLALPVRLSDHLSWLTDSKLDARTLLRFTRTFADVPEMSPIARNIPIVPLPTYRKFTLTEGRSNKQSGRPAFSEQKAFVVVLDTVILQRQGIAPRGIARVWRSLLPILPSSIAERLLKSEPPFSSLGVSEFHFILLARQGTPESIVEDWYRAALFLSEMENSSRIHYQAFVEWAPPFDEADNFTQDGFAIGTICRRVKADVFLSTDYSVPLRAHGNGAGMDPIKQVLLIHDMTPERFGWEDNFWTTFKRRAILKADAYVAVSYTTADAFRRLYKKILATQTKEVYVAYNAVHDSFLSTPENASELSVHSYYYDNNEVIALKDRLGIVRDIPYFIFVGMRLGYKNAGALFETLASSRVSHGCVSQTCAFNASLLLVGGTPVDQSSQEMPLLQNLRNGIHVIYKPWLSDKDLSLAYRGAAALVYLSLDEGFGLPFVEALACGCPVLASDIPIFRELTFPVGHYQNGAILDYALIDAQGSATCSSVYTEVNASGAVSEASQPGIFLVDPSSVSQINRAFGCLVEAWRTPQSVKTRSALAAYSRRRFGSWKPLSESVARAVVGVNQPSKGESHLGKIYKTTL